MYLGRGSTIFLGEGWGGAGGASFKKLTGGACITVSDAGFTFQFISKSTLTTDSFVLSLYLRKIATCKC